MNVGFKVTKKCLSEADVFGAILPSTDELMEIHGCLTSVR